MMTNPSAADVPLGPSAVPMLGAGMTSVDRFAILYLAFPVAAFFILWFSAVYGVIFGLAALAGLVPLWSAPAARPPRRTLAAAVVAALLWSSLSGAGHFFDAGTALNWPIRDAVLRDLVLLHQPVSYGLQDGVATILRAPIAYYMVPAMLARLAGVHWASVLLYLWTALGVLLFLLQVM